MRDTCIAVRLGRCVGAAVMSWLRALPAIGLAALVGVTLAQREQIASLTADKASLERSQRALILERDQAREARAVADAWRAREAADAQRFREIKEDIRKGPDDEIPDWYLDRLCELGVVRAGGDCD